MQKGQNIHFTRGGNFQFSARGGRYVYLKKKKNQPGLKFHSGVNFTSPTFNMPLSFEFFILKLKIRTDSNIPFDFLVDAKVVVRSRIN